MNTGMHKVEGGYLLWCPGCRHGHIVYTVAKENRPCWQFDGNEEAPTFSPSLLVRIGEQRDKDGTVYPEERCHSFIRNGQWQFLSDCTHDLADQTIPMEAFP